MSDDDDIPELKLSGKPVVLCTSAYQKKKEDLSRILGISLVEADNLLQEKGIDRMA